LIFPPRPRFPDFDYEDEEEDEDDFMKRHVFKMKLKPGKVAEYKKRHDEIWTELAAELRAAGVSDYSIFLDEETLTLFAVQKLSDNNSAADLPKSPVVRKWWDYMAPLMEVYPDNSPVCGEMREVFHLD
jgi:L-rhamnose mutarotase